MSWRCVGGPLTYENKYVARNKVMQLVSELPCERPEETVPCRVLNSYDFKMDTPIPENCSMQLDEEVSTAIEKMERINDILESLPGYDCGSCGSPTCRSFAEDIVGILQYYRLYIHTEDRLKVMAQQMDMSNTKRINNESK